ncbi:microtubule-associated protein futsch-like isoform X2 [Argopecten irradians]
MKNSWRSKWNWFKITIKFKLKLKQKAKCQQSSKKLKTEETKRHTEGLTDSCRDLTEGKHQHHVLSLDECCHCQAHEKCEGNCQHQSSKKLVEDRCVDDTGIDISSLQQKHTVDNTNNVSLLQLNTGLLESQFDIGEDLTVDWKSADTLSTTGNNLYHHGCNWSASDIELLGSSLTLTSFNEDMENCMSDFPDDDGPLKSSNLCTIHCLDDTGLQYQPDFTKSGLYACLRRDKYYCFSCTPLKTSSLDLFTCNSNLVDALDLSEISRHWPLTTQNEDKIQPSKHSCSSNFQYEDTSHPSTPSCTAKSPNGKMTLASKPACSDYTRNEEMTQASKLVSFSDNSQDEDTAHDQPSKPFYCSDYTQDEEMTAASKPAYSDCTEDDKMSAASKLSHSDYTEDDKMTEASKPSCSEDSLDDKMSAASKPACSDYTEDDEMTEASKPSCSDDSLEDKMSAASKHACSDYTEDDEMTEASKPSCSDNSLDDKMSAASKPACSDYTQDDEMTEASKPSCSDDSLDDKMSAASKPACFDYTMDKDTCTQRSKPSRSDNMIQDKDKGLRAQKNCLPNSRSYKQKSKNKIQPIIYRKRKRTYEKVKYRREADHVFQKTQLRQKVFLENLKEHIRQKAHVFHRKSCQGIRTARRKAHQSDMKFVKSTGRLDRKLHGLYEKGLRSLQTWEHRHAFCDGLGSNCSSKKAENKKRKKSFIFHRSILKNHSKSFHILKMNYTADVLCRYFLKYHLKRKTNLIQMGVCKRKIIGKEISEISDHEKNTENNKRKMGSEAYNDFQESEENIWQAKSKAYKQLRQSKERPTDTTSIISQHLSTDGGRPGGKPDTFKSHVYQPRCEQVRRSAPCNPQQPSQPAVVQIGERNSPRDMVAGSATQSMTIQSSDQRVVPSTSLFQNLLTNLPSAGQFEFCGKKLQLRCICQVACILATIICFNSAFPLFEDNLRNANRNFRWLYHICRKCKAGRFFEAIKRFWLKHGKDYFGNKSFISFKIKLEADWILEPLGIKVIEKRSKCTNKSCTFRQRGKPDSDKFSSSIREFSRRSFCLRDPNPLRKFPRFQSLFDEWQAEDICCVCMNGTIRVTRMLDDTQGPPPPLLPIPTFFQKGNIEIPLPVLLNHYKTDRQPEEVKIGNQR